MVMSKKLQYIKSGETYYTDLPNGITCVASMVDGYIEEYRLPNGSVSQCYRNDYYKVTSHNGDMPAFHSVDCDTLAELGHVMRGIADLRRWKPQAD